MGKKKVHWTQRPENRAKVQAQMKRAAAKRRKEQPLTPLLNELDELRHRAVERLAEINSTMKALEEERRAIVNAFPDNTLGSPQG